MKITKASDEFVVGKHKIGYIWGSFQSEFGKDKIEKGKFLSFKKLEKSMTDAEIISELGIQECTLGDILATLDKATEEMKDGNWNIFYIKNHPSRVVRVRWDDGGWLVYGWDRDGDWYAGLRVFSPATALDSGPSSALSSDSLKLDEAISLVKKNGYKVTKEF